MDIVQFETSRRQGVGIKVMIRRVIGWPRLWSISTWFLMSRRELVWMIGFLILRRIRWEGGGRWCGKSGICMAFFRGSETDCAWRAQFMLRAYTGIFEISWKMETALTINCSNRQLGGILYGRLSRMCYRGHLSRYHHLLQAMVHQIENNLWIVWTNFILRNIIKSLLQIGVFQCRL